MFPAIAIPKFDKARNIPLQPPKIQPGLPFCGQSRFRTLTKYRKNEAFIRNDGVYVISGIFREQMLAFAEKNTFPSRSLAANL